MTDITEKLRQIEEAPVGGSMPACLGGDGVIDWATPLKAIAKAAREEIESLRNQLEDEIRSGDRDL